MGSRKAQDQPIRTCVGCRSRRPQSELLRLALDSRGQVVWDLVRRRPGRGAWLCPSADCLAAAGKKGRLQRAFRGPAVLDELMNGQAPWETRE